MSLFDRFRDWLVERDLKRRPIEAPDHSEPGGATGGRGDDTARFLMGGAPERLTGEDRRERP